MQIRTMLRLLMASTLVTMLALAGCAARTVVGGAPDADEGSGDQWTNGPVCRVIEGDPSVFPDAVDSAWWQDGGNMWCVASTAEPVAQDNEALAGSRDEAIARAAERLLPGAFDMLERRGVVLSRSRRDEATREFANAVARGEEADFPRVSIQETVVEQCESAEGADHWRARLLAEYPIGVLRGDVKHAQWEGRRLQREMEMRIVSAEGLLADGRWLDGLLQMYEADDLLRRLGAKSVTGDTALNLRRNFTDEEGVFAPRFVRVGGQGPLVLNAGARASVRYRLEYRMAEKWIRASGVPVVVYGGSLVRPVTGVTETDASGEIAFDVAAGSEPGDDSFHIVAEVFPRLRLMLPAGTADQKPDVAAEIVQRVVVLSSRDATVCVEINAERAGEDVDDSDVDRVREALSNSLKALGVPLVDCGPHASLVVTADVILSTQEAHGAWVAHAECSVRAFDQRLAEDVGRVSFEVQESLESSARDAEMLALREVGRLIAVYLEPRLAER